MSKHTVLVFKLGLTPKLVKGIKKGNYVIYERNHFALISTKPVFYKKKELYYVKEEDLNTFDASTLEEVTDEKAQQFLAFFKDNQQYIRHEKIREIVLTGNTLHIPTDSNFKHLLAEDMVFAFVDMAVIKNMLHAAQVHFSTYLPYICMGFGLGIISLIILSAISPETVYIRVGKTP